MTRRVSEPGGLRRAAAASFAVSLAASLAALLTACSGLPPTRFHTLMGAPSSSSPTKIAAAGMLAWEVQPVTIPAQVDQPQWVVRTVDGSLAVLEQERWIAPLADEIRGAVNDRLTQSLGAAAPMSAAEPGRRWRVRIHVQRFETVPAREVRLEADWTVRSDADAAVALSCHGEFVQAVASTGYLVLARAHQQGVAQLADAIGRALKALNAGQPASCSG